MITGLMTESHFLPVIYFPHPVLSAILLDLSVTLLAPLALQVTDQVLLLLFLTRPPPNELAHHLMTNMEQMFLCALFTMEIQMTIQAVAQKDWST